MSTTPFDPARTSPDFQRRNPNLYPRGVVTSLGLGAGAEVEVAQERRIRQRHGPKMNKLEARFLEWLTHEHCIGERVYPQAVTLLLCNGVRYTADFFVPMIREKEGGGYESLGTLYETKGPQAITDDSIVKIKMAAHEFPCFTFFLCWQTEGHWQMQKVLP